MTTPTTPAASAKCAGRRSPRNLLAAYDQSNDQASEIILGDPKRHTRFQINWAQKYAARRKQEGREAVN